jgi:hypothetical protein
MLATQKLDTHHEALTANLDPSTFNVKDNVKTLGT